MRDLTDEFKLSARSTPQVFLVLGTMINRLQADRRVRFRGKKPTRAALVNAALLYLDSLPQAQWEQALQIGLSRLEGYLAEEGDAPFPAGATGGEAAEPLASAGAGPGGEPAVAAKAAPTSAKPRAGGLRVEVEDVSPESPATKPVARAKKRG